MNGGREVIPALLHMRGMKFRAIVTALPSVLRKGKEQALWLGYVAECVRIITENTAKSAQGGGVYMAAKYDSIITPPPAETRTGDEIIEHMKAKLTQIGGE